MKFQQLQNELVTLMPIERAHIDSMTAAIDERIWTHLSVTLKTRDDVEAYIERAITARAQGESFMFAIIDNATGAVIGSTSFLNISEAHGHVEIGSTWLTPRVWRSSVNTSCKTLLLAYCFEELQLHRVQIKTDHLNTRSQQAIERLGATKEGVLRKHMVRKDGTVRDTVMYSIIAEEWPHVKIRLQQLQAGR